MDFQSTCPFCKANVSPTDFFCPSCGKKLKEKPLSTSIGKQIYIFALSLLLPPLGLWPAIKYLRQHDEKSKTVGCAAVVLTIISTIITIWITTNFIKSFQAKMDNSMAPYQDLGF